MSGWSSSNLVRWSGLVALLAACGDDPRHLEPNVLEPTILPCEPACPGGHACFDGVCYAVCEPACPLGTHCTADGLCEADITDGPGEAFERNPCGGVTALPGLPGDACGPCGTGKYVCEWEEAVACVDPVGANACGGCGELPGEPAAECGEEARWACTPEGGLECVPWLDMNPCLGTVDLPGPPGRRCGECGAGYWACETPNETSCFEPTAAPSSCECDPATSPAISCGTDAGICTRGVRLCQPDGTYGSCVQAAPGTACNGDGDCSTDARCVEETIGPEESVADTCRTAGAAECTQRVCRLLTGTRACTGDGDCAPTQGCAAGFCRDLAIRPLDERCNGIDDDCDGLIDDDHDRLAICGTCPYNMALVANPGRYFGRERYCIDLFEASRPDASSTSPGVEALYAASRPDVLPWSNVTAAQALAACAGDAYNAEVPGGIAVRRLCVADEWDVACNQEGRRYPYGDDYVAGACNDASIGLSEPDVTGSANECGYAEPGSGYAVFDLVGNVEEWVRGEDGMLLAGGSIASGEAEASCDATRPLGDEGAGPVGFRCCAAPVRAPEASSGGEP